MIVLTILLVILALAVLTVGLLGFMEKLPGNGVVGLRIPEVRKSPENWVLAHKIAGPAWMGAGAALLGAALLTTGIGGWMWLVFALLIVGALFLIGMGSAMAASTMARLEHLRGQEAEEARSAAGCCSSGSSSDDDASAGGCEPTAEECASGNSCGSCSLNGACEGGEQPSTLVGTPVLVLGRALSRRQRSLHWIWMRLAARWRSRTAARG